MIRSDNYQRICEASQAAATTHRGGRFYADAYVQAMQPDCVTIVLTRAGRDLPFPTFYWQFSDLEEIGLAEINRRTQEAVQ